MMRKLLFVMTVAVLFGLNTMAFALPCGSGGVSGSIECQDGIGNNDKVVNPLTVNSEEFFTFDDWEYLAKQNTPGDFEGSTDYGWTVTPTTGTQSGDWSFNSSVWANFEDVMIVVKGGNNNGIFFSGYLLDNQLKPELGTWDTGGKNLSHLTLYGRGDGLQPPPVNPVPEPATMLLFGTGIVALVGARLRRKKK
jgi:hypothetical protein